MTNPDAPKSVWASRFSRGEPDKVALARIVDEDGGRDDAETSYYESVADPAYVRMEGAQRRFRGQYFRRLRRLDNRARQNSHGDGS